ncbi:uncharacterized protein LOC100175054 [Ciona intestinalis]
MNGKRFLLCQVGILVLAVTIANTQNYGYDCNFNNNMCGWRNALKSENVDDFNWKRGYGSNGKQKGSGTNDDHRGGGGYMYIKSKNRMNRTAKFLSRSVITNHFTCLKFWYFMKGRNMGHLAIYLAKDRLHLADNSNNPLWNLRGHQGNTWREAKVPLPPQKNTIIVIEAFDWRVGRSGNILLDDVSLHQVTESNTCQVQPSYAAPKPLTITTTTTATTATTTQTTTATATVKTKTTTTTNTSIEYNTTSTTSYDFQPNSTQAMKPMTTPKTISLFNITSPAISPSKNSTKTDPNSAQIAGTKNESYIYIVVGVLGAASILAVALIIYARRRKKLPRSMYDDNVSVTISRMYPDQVTITRTSDYSKLKSMD